MSAASGSSSDHLHGADAATDSAIGAAPVALWLERLAAPVPDPGGGAAAGVVIATGAALTEMAAGYAAPSPERDRVLAAAALARAEALRGADADAQMSGALVAAFRLPADAPERPDRIRATTIEAASASVALVAVASALRSGLMWLETHGEARLAPDVAVAARMLACGIRSSAVNIRCDTTSAEQFAAPTETVTALHRDAASALAEAELLDALADRVTATV